MQIDTLTAKGQGGTVLSFDGSFVTITRSGFMASASVGKGEKRIPISSITAVQWKNAGISTGFIQFTVAGGVEMKSKGRNKAGDALHDENSVVFLKKHADDFAMIRAAVETAMSQPATVAMAASSSSLAEELGKLNDLRVAGIITDEEFAAQKARLLAG
jgi:hypothetical protein